MSELIKSRRNPARIESGVLGMAIFLMGETMLFAGLISASTFLRSKGAEAGFDEGLRLPIWLTISNMIVLLASGATLALSRGRRTRVGIAAILGAVFLLVQGVEWMRLVAHGFSVSTNVASGLFYAIVGTHALHVACGLACLSYALIRFDRQTLKVCAMYWYFVVLVWPLLYITVYF